MKGVREKESTVRGVDRKSVPCDHSVALLSKGCQKVILGTAA